MADLKRCLNWQVFTVNSNIKSSCSRNRYTGYFVCIHYTLLYSICCGPGSSDWLTASCAQPIAAYRLPHLPLNEAMGSPSVSGEHGSFDWHPWRAHWSSSRKSNLYTKIAYIQTAEFAMCEKFLIARVDHRRRRSHLDMKLVSSDKKSHLIVIWSCNLALLTSIRIHCPEYLWLETTGYCIYYIWVSCYQTNAEKGCAVHKYM